MNLYTLLIIEKSNADSSPENSNWSLIIIPHSTSVWATDTAAKLP